MTTSLDLEKYVEDVYLGLLQYSITGINDDKLDKSVLDIFEETMTNTVRYADNTMGSALNILSPELVSIVLINHSIQKTIIRSVNINKNALVSDKQILGLMAKQFGFDKLDIFLEDSQRQLLNKIGDLYQRKGTISKLVEVLQLLKLSNTRVIEYYLTLDKDLDELTFVALDKIGDVDRSLDYEEITEKDNNWFATEEEIRTQFIECPLSDPIKSPYFEIDTSLVYEGDNPANFASAIISSLRKRDELIYSDLPAEIPNIRIINDVKTGLSCSFIELILSIGVIFNKISGSAQPPHLDNYFKYGYNPVYFLDANQALEDIVNTPDPGLIDQIRIDSESVASTDRNTLVRRQVLDDKRALFYESKFNIGGTSNDITADVEVNLGVFNEPFSLALQALLNDPDTNVNELFIHYTRLLTSYLSVRYRDSNAVPIFNIDNITKAILDLINFLKPEYTTFLGATTTLTFKNFPDDVVPHHDGVGDLPFDPSGVSTVFLERTLLVPLNEIVCWTINFERLFEMDLVEESSISYQLKPPAEDVNIFLDEDVSWTIQFKIIEDYVHNIRYDIPNLEYDDASAFERPLRLFDTFTFFITMGIQFEIPLEEQTSLELFPFEIPEMMQLEELEPEFSIEFTVCQTTPTRPRYDIDTGDPIPSECANVYFFIRSGDQEIIIIEDGDGVIEIEQTISEDITLLDDTSNSGSFFLNFPPITETVWPIIYDSEHIETVYDFPNLNGRDPHVITVLEETIETLAFGELNDIPEITGTSTELFGIQESVNITIVP